MKKHILITLALLFTTLTLAQDQIDLSNNMIFEPLAEGETLYTDLIHLSAQTGSNFEMASQSFQYLLKIEAAGEHLLNQKSSIKYAQVQFYYSGNANKKRLLFTIVPVSLGFKDLAAQYLETYVGILPISLENDEFAGSGSAKISLLGFNAKQSIPFDMATLVIKESIKLFSYELSRSGLELIDAQVEARYKIDSLITLLAGLSQAIYVNNYQDIFSKWVSGTGAYVGLEIGLDVGDAVLGIYAKGGTRSSYGKNLPYLEVGVNLGDVLGLNPKKKSP